MPEKHSKLAIALAEVIMDQTVQLDGVDAVAAVIDNRLAEVRKAYEPEELSRCPIVTHHGDSACAFCVTSAMRAFILLLPEDL